MLSVRLVPLATLLLLFSWACRHGEVRSDDEYPVTWVDGREITARWFRQTYFDFLVRSGANDTRQNRYLHLNNLVDALLLAEEADRRGLREDSLSDVYFERERKKALGGRFYEEEFVSQVPPPTDQEVRQAFARWKSEVAVRHLFYLDPDSADAAYRRLKAGRDFLEEARDCYGLAGVDSSAGYLGPIRYFTMDDAFAEAAFSLQPGEFSAPVQSRFGYHIIRVENIVRNPLLTESEYQTRRGGIEKRVRIRKLRLSGDRFMREYARGLDLQVNEAAVRALGAFLREAEGQREQPVTISEGESIDEDLDGMLADLEPEAELATYVWNGRERVFTVRDYFFWLPALPYAERRSRIGASVGRAIRNEVLALEGEQRGLDDERVERSVRREGALFLARRLLNELRADTTVRPTDDQLRTAFRRFGLDRRQLHTADFWMVPFPDAAVAERAKNRVLANLVAARSFDGYTEMTNVDLETQPAELRYFLRQAPLGKPVVVGLSGDNWIVLDVTRREQRQPSFETSRDILEQRLRPHIAEYNLLAELRRGAEIRVDTTRFEQVMAFEEQDAGPTRP